MTELCIKPSPESRCAVTFRVRVLGYISKVPGIYEFSRLSYRTFVSPTSSVRHAWPDPAIMVSEHQLREIIAKFRGVPADSEFYIPKNRLLVSLHEGTPEKKTIEIRNNLLKYAGDLNIYSFNTDAFVKKIQENLALVDIFCFIIEVFAFVLCFFQVIVAVNTNMQETGWELGVLRAMGLTKNEMRKVALLESAIVMTSGLFLGLVIGIASAVMQVQTFDLVLEIPIDTPVPFVEIGLLVLFAYMSLFIGTLTKLHGMCQLSIQGLLKEAS